MDLQARAIADARIGAGPTSRDKVLAIIGVVLRVLLLATSPFGFMSRGFLREASFVVGAWLMITSLPFLLNLGEIWMRRAAGQQWGWTTTPSWPMRVYATVGAALVMVSMWPGGGSIGGSMRLHWSALMGWGYILGFWALVIGIPTVLVIRKLSSTSLGLQHHNARVVDRRVARDYKNYHAANWSVRVGVATGSLSRRDPLGALPAGLHVRLGLADASRGVLVLGAMGSGKTQFLRSCAVDAARQGSGLIALSAKPDDANAIISIARQYRDAANVHLIAADAESVNLLAGMTPARIGAVFKALSHDPNTPYWANYSGMMVTAAAQLAWALAGTAVPISDVEGNIARQFDVAYDLTTIHRFIWGGAEARLAALQQAVDALPALRRANDLERVDAIEAAFNYFSTSFVDLSESKSTMANVKSGIEPYILPLISGTQRRIWGDPDGINITSALDAGDVVVLAPDKAANAQVFDLVASFTVAHLADLALRRTVRSQNRALLALLDEYGSYASTDHLGLIETARQARIVLIMSSISVTNLSARLGSDGAAAIPSAFSNLLCFATGDGKTRKLVDSRIGKVRLSEISSGSSTSSGSQPGRSTTNESVSHRMSEVSVIDDAVWRSLGIYQSEGYATAIAIVSENSRSLHDVVRVPPASVTT